MASETTREAVEILTSARNLVVSDIRSAVEGNIRPASELSTAVVRLTHAIEHMRLTDYGALGWNDLWSDAPLSSNRRV